MGVYKKYITPTQVKAYYFCPHFFELRYVQDTQTEEGTGMWLGEKNHDIFLRTIEDLLSMPSFSLEDYRSSLKKNAEHYGKGMPPEDISNIVREYIAPEKTIFRRMQIDLHERPTLATLSELSLLSPDRFKALLEEKGPLLLIEENFYSNQLQLHSVPDIVLVDKGPVVYVYDLKTGPFPKYSTFPHDAVSTVASAMPVKERFGHIDKVIVLYTQSDRSLREISFNQWSPVVNNAIDGIKQRRFEPKTANCRTPCTYYQSVCTVTPPPSSSSNN